MPNRSGFYDQGVFKAAASNVFQHAIQLPACVTVFACLLLLIVSGPASEIVQRLQSCRDWSGLFLWSTDQVWELAVLPAPS